MKKKLLIFDLDGTLANTSDANYFAYKQALQEVGVGLDYNYFCNYCNGRHFRDFLPVIMKGKVDKIEFVHQRKKQLYSDYVKKVIPNNFLCDCINNMKKIYFMAVVTTASKKNCYEVLREINILDSLDLILTQEDVKIMKPDPEGFLKAMSYFKLGSEDTTIFEDSDIGIEAALKTGTQVIKILNFDTYSSQGKY